MLKLVDLPALLQTWMCVRIRKAFLVMDIGCKELPQRTGIETEPLCDGTPGSDDPPKWHHIGL
jgi:hypothetical protein